MPVRRPPRPHRFDVRIAAGGLLGGLLLVVAGLGTRPSSDPITLFAGPWAVLPPLLVTAGCELMRRTAPRAALLTATAAVCADLATQGHLSTVLMVTGVIEAAAL